jgi:putative hydrolase of the HAD superfamily
VGKAIIFDLFGTLVENFAVDSHEDAVAGMSRALGLSHETFRRAWSDGTYLDRITGRCPTLRASIEQALGALGVDAAPWQVDAAVQARVEFTRAALQPKHDAVQTLTRLWEGGYRLGLVSDCAPEVPELWPATPFATLIDVPVFSCAVGLRKPDPRIYALAAERLGVGPAECLFVGDGSSRELSGALAAGMQAVLVRVSLANVYDKVREDVESWQGPSVGALEELLGLLPVLRSVQAGGLLL